MMRLTKHKIFVGVLGTVILLTACTENETVATYTETVVTHTETAETHTEQVDQLQQLEIPSGYQEYRDADNEYSFVYPEEWIKISAENHLDLEEKIKEKYNDDKNLSQYLKEIKNPSEVTFFDGLGADHHLTLGVHKKNYKSGIDNLKEDKEVYLNSYMEKLKYLEIVKDVEIIQLNHCEAVIMAMNHNINGKQNYIESYFIVGSNNDLYEISFLFQKGDYELYEESIQTMVNSFIYE